MTSARSILVRGTVQGVGFRPFVYRLARGSELAGWVLNGGDGVEIFVEGSEPALDGFVRNLKSGAPPAARITTLEVLSAEPAGLRDFVIRESARNGGPSVRISPDLPVCADCLRELFDPNDRRYLYPYINCANCGPRYTIVQALPYDRGNTTMKSWALDRECAAQYEDPRDRRFHAQPVACRGCGPHYYLRNGHLRAEGDQASIRNTAEHLAAGGIVAVKGLGGYHLACDARNAATVRALRERKFRKEKPFAVMAKSAAVARELVSLSPQAEELLTSAARPIVLAPARLVLDAVAPGSDELGVMLPYTPLHHLLFAAGAPEALVMTSANRSNEPTAYEDDDALRQLAGIADAFLIGERPIARRVDDSVARMRPGGPVILRRARGYAPGAVCRLPVQQPILALGADLKNTITLAVDGQAFVSQHIGDLEHYGAFESFTKTVRDLTAMYEVDWDDVLLVHDAHPQYASTSHAAELPAPKRRAIQHHCAHVASVLAEREDWDTPVIGAAFDGTGYGDDDAIWGGEIFSGSIASGFVREAHLRYALLPGGDSAARHPVQAAAGFLGQLDGLADAAALFRFPPRFAEAAQLVEKRLRTFPASSMGRLFDTAAAMLGFTRPITFEGQAAMWLEHLARPCPSAEAYPFPFNGEELDFRPLLYAVAGETARGEDPAAIARAFHRGIAKGTCAAILELCGKRSVGTVVLSGGVFQNELLLADFQSILKAHGMVVRTNSLVPPNDGGISLGQAALAALGRVD